jgi:LuxR family maltose regulon positive regulatory protein
MRARPPRARALGGLDDGPLPDGFASLESSLAVLSADVRWGDVAAILEHGARSASSRAGLAVAAGDHVGARLGALLQRRPRRAERWLEETTRIAPPAEQWIVGVGGDRRPVADRGHARAPRRAAAPRRGALASPAPLGLLDAVEDGEVHTAYGVALVAHGRYEEALPSLEKGVFLRRCGGRSST